MPTKVSYIPFSLKHSYLSLGLPAIFGCSVYRKNRNVSIHYLCFSLNLQAIAWISELCQVLTETQVQATQPNADIDALHAEQQKFESTAQVINT